MLENAMRDLKDQNSAYSELKSQQDNFEELTEEIIESIENHDDQETLKRYLNILEVVQMQECEHLYFTGYRDCVSMLKTMGVL